MDSYGPTILLIMLISASASLVNGRSCVCAGNRCANIYQIQMPVDFKTAEKNCTERGGHLSIQSNASDEVIGHLLDNTIGHFWIRSHPYGDKCANPTSNTTTEFTNWETEEKSCAPLCVSVSSDRILTVRPCTDKLDGFLCQDTQGDLCKGKVAFLNKDRCSSAPCEHICTPVTAGYTCSCKQRFRTNRRDPRRCDFYCDTTVCKALCIRGGSACWCPAGFIRNEQNCEDVDECESNHDCAQKCHNSIGSYKCACFEPYALVNGTACVYSSGPLNNQVFTTASSNFIAQGALSTPGEYVWLIIFLAVAVFALLALVYYLRGRKATAEQESNSPGYDASQGSER